MYYSKIIGGATNMKMGNSQKQNIAIQHRVWNKTGTQKSEPIEFDKWFLISLRKCEKKGAEFTFLCPGLVRIKWAEQAPMLRTLADFEREYQEEYLSKFYP
jgi:hypothetical protein